MLFNQNTITQYDVLARHLLTIIFSANATPLLGICMYTTVATARKAYYYRTLKLAYQLSVS